MFTLLILLGTLLTLSTLNVKSNYARGQTSRSVTHPGTTPARARLTPFLPDELPREKSYLADNTTISILLTLIQLCHMYLFILNFKHLFK